MFDLSKTRLEQLVIHKVGNPSREEGMSLSAGPIVLYDGDLEELLLKYFLSPFREKVVRRFWQEEGLQQHELYHMLSNVFIRPTSFYDESVKILERLYEKSRHPQIRGGEFYMARLSGCLFGASEVEAIGLFKTERRENYLKVAPSGSGFVVSRDQGISVRRLDKGAIVFNTESPDGYRVAIVDHVSRGRDQETADYWREDFLGLTEVRNEYFHTEKYLDLCQDFAENVYGPLCQADKKDKVVFMNEAIAYFDKNQEFQMDDFVHNVVKTPEIIEQFQEHKKMYEANQGIEPAETFSISGPAVKTVKRRFKNLIKLDTDIEIRVKGSGENAGETGYIERGYDADRGMHFYKVYFNEEE
ncbi:MAG TPA: nucleoid-associated protein [Patescibacteria group bacterium]|nr:nucleoid-associated protein [Patescibacteria group bacterium]